MQQLLFTKQYNIKKDVSFYDIDFNNAVILLDPLFGKSRSGLLNYLDENIEHYALFYFNSDKTLIHDLSMTKNFRYMFCVTYNQAMMLSNQQPMSNLKLCAYINKDLKYIFDTTHNWFRCGMIVKNYRSKGYSDKYKKDWRFVVDNLNYNAFERLIDLNNSNNLTIYKNESIEYIIGDYNFEKEG